MTMFPASLAHKILLNPTVEQEIALRRAAGVARFTYNWALNEWNKQFKFGGKPKASELKKYFNSIKGAQFPWVYESPRDANSQPFANLQAAFQRFFKKKAKRPTFKKRGQHDSFYVSNDKFSVDGKTVKLPVIGEVRMAESLRFGGRILSGTVSKTEDSWYISITVETGREHARKPQEPQREVLGVDLGLKTAVVCSDSTKYEAPKPLKRYLGKLQRQSRAHSRKQKGSNNRKKSAARLAKIHARVANIRRDWLHKVTTALSAKTKLIVLEDLNVAGMLKNRRLSRAISDVGWSEFQRQIAYKTALYGGYIHFVDRFYPSSKTCSSCGNVKKELLLSEREYTCEACGVIEDRDINAAKNLEAVGYTVYACGQESSGSETELNETILDEAGTTTLRVTHLHSLSG